MGSIDIQLKTNSLNWKGLLTNLNNIHCKLSHFKYEIVAAVTINYEFV